MKTAARFVVIVVLSLVARMGLAHEFWIEARDYQVPEGAQIAASLKNGMNFKGVEMAWFPPRVVHAGWMQGPHGGAFDSTPGDRPALHLMPERTGLYQLIYEASPSTLTYTEWEKFTGFVTSEGHDWAIERHRQRGLPESGFSESYTRHCKALVAVGNGAGADSYTGMEAELVALSNPFDPASRSQMTVELRYQGDLAADMQILVFDRAPGGTVQKTPLRTDARGQASLPVRAAHRYLLSAVFLREPENPGPETKYVWESLWASLTFEMPQ